MKKRFSIFILISFCLCYNFFGQKKDLKLNHRTSIDGLSSDWINSLTEDKRGFIWIGSRHGLNIYDGKEFNSLFHRDNDSTTISGNDVSVVVNSRSGNIIAGTWGAGINFVNPITKQITKPEKDGVSEKLNVKSIIETTDSSIWIGTYGNGFFKYEQKTNTLVKCNYKSINDSTDASVYNECEGMCIHNNKIWITSHKGGLGIIDRENNTIEHYTHPNYDQSIIRNIISLNSKKDKLLIGTAFSLYHELDTKTGEVTLTKKITKNGNDSIRVSSILIDQKNTIWITSSDGVVKKNGKTNEFTFLANAQKKTDNIYCSLEDSRGVIWFGNWGTGLAKHVQEPNEFLETDPGGINNWAMNALCDFDEKKILLGTSKGLFLFDKKNNSIITPTFQGDTSHILRVSHRNILGITKQKDNSYLLLIDQLGFYKIDQNLSISKHHFSYGTIRKKLSYSFLTTTADGNTWLGTSNKGLYLYAKETGEITHYSKEEKDNHLISSNNVYAVFMDKSQQIWICTEAGVMEFDKSSNKFVDFNLTLSNASTTESSMTGVKSMLQDENGNFWFSSSTGLVHHNTATGSSTLYGKESDHDDQAMYSISQNGDHIWGIVQDGTYSLNVKTKKAKYHPITDGVKLSLTKTSLVFDNNKIYLNYLNGIETLDTKELIKEKVSLELFIHNFLVNDQEKWTSDIDKNISRMRNISLENDENNISIILSIIDFRKSKHDAFTHQLIGFEDKPTIHDSQHKRIKYTNLDPGEYELIIASIDSKNEDSKFKHTIAITIEKPIWEKWWFLISVILISLIIIYLFFKYRTYTIEKKNKELKKYAEEKNKETKQKNRELTKTYEELAIKDKHLNNNVNYASVIQTTLLPNSEEITTIFPNSFVIFRPRNVVSGDFYCSIKRGNKNIFVVADCTGHGVSGAFISVLGITYIKSIIYSMQTTQPDQILNQLHLEMTRSLRQKTSNIKDGMDITVMCFDDQTKELEVSSAQGLMLIAEDGEELIQVKGDKFPIGGSTKQYTHRKDFALNTFQIKKRTMLYLFSDGYQDQFGGEENFKFMKGRFRKLLVSNKDEELNTQKDILENTLDDWQQDKKQTDDILVVGIELK